MGEFGELPNVPDLTVDEAQKKQEEGGETQMCYNVVGEYLVLISAHHLSLFLCMQAIL